MPRFSYLNTIFREPWMIEPETAAANRQVLVGLLQGLEFTPEDYIANYSLNHQECPTVPAGRTVNVVNLSGTMMREDGDCGQVGTRTLGNRLLEGDSDPKCIGHILLVDSGGGASNSVDDLADAIVKCSKPVVAYVDGLMCSAAMFAASYCAAIIAHKDMDRVGCIGTLVQLAGYPKEVRDSDGFIQLRIYADGSEEKNQEYEEALKGNFTLIKENTLNPLNERFKAEIRKNRPNVSEDQLKGRTYFAKDAIGSLIDSIGDFESAVDKVIELSNINITNMKGFEKIQSLGSCHDLQEVDGTVTLTHEQLEEIENAIPAATDAQQITQLQSENASLRQQVEERDTTIAELQATVTRMGEKPTPPATPGHNGNHVSEETDNENPEEYCENLMHEIYG